MKLKLSVLTRVVKKTTAVPGMLTFKRGRCPISTRVSYRAQIGNVSAPLITKETLNRVGATYRKRAIMNAIVSTVMIETPKIRPLRSAASAVCLSICLMTLTVSVYPC